MLEQVPHEVEHGDPALLGDAAGPVKHEDDVHLLGRVVSAVEPVDQLLACEHDTVVRHHWAYNGER